MNEFGDSCRKQFQVIVDVQDEVGLAALQRIISLAACSHARGTSIVEMYPGDAEGCICCHGAGTVVTAGVPDKDLEEPVRLPCQGWQAHAVQVVRPVLGDDDDRQ